MTLLLRYWKVAGLILVALAVLWHWTSDVRREKEIDGLRMTLAQEQVKYRDLEAQFLQVTKAAADLTLARKQSDEARSRIQADLLLTQRRLRAVQVPKECPAAVDWLINERK